MAYSEYFNYANCTHAGVYSDALNQCVVSYNNASVYTNYANIFMLVEAGNYADTYSNSVDYHYGGYTNIAYQVYANYINTSGSCPRYGNTSWYVDSSGGYHTVPAGQYAGGRPTGTYFNYTGWDYGGRTAMICQVYSTQNNIYADVPTNCQTYYNYTNHTDFLNPNINGPIELTYSSPWDSGNLDVLYISESIDAIKNLRANVLEINNTKQTDAVIDMFGENALNGAKVIADAHYKKFRTTLDNLWNDLKSVDTGSGLPEKIQGDQLNKVDIELIKVKIDELAATDSTTTYSNAFSRLEYADINYSEYI